MGGTLVSRFATPILLGKAWKRIKEKIPRSKRVKLDSRGDSVNSIDEHLTDYLAKIATALRSPTGYHFGGLVAHAIPKKDKDQHRIICVPSLADRLVQRAILTFLSASDYFDLHNSISFGYVSDPEKTVSKAAELARQERKLHPWAYKTDITQFFDRIPRQELTYRISKLCTSKPLLELLRRALSCEIARNSPASESIILKAGINRGSGLRQGMPLSPLLANLILRDFDRVMKKKCIRMIRYADDLIALADSEEECVAVHALCAKELAKIGLDIPPIAALGQSKTQIAGPADPIEFLGVSLELEPGGSGYILNIPKASLDKMRDKIANFGDLSQISNQGITIASIGRSITDLRDGWISAYRHCNNSAILVQSLDSWTAQAIKRLFTNGFGLDFASLDQRQKTFLLIPDLL